MMRHSTWRYVWSAGCAGLVMLGLPVAAQQAGAPAGAASSTPPPMASNPIASVPSAPAAPADSNEIRKKVAEQGERIEAMRSQISAQMAQLDAMKRALAEQEADYQSLRHAVGIDVLDKQRAGNIAA